MIGAIFDLPPGDVDAFVRLRMGTQRNAAFSRKAAHFVEIRFEPVQIQHQAGSWEIVDFFHGLQCTTPNLTETGGISRSRFAAKVIGNVSLATFPAGE